MITEAKLIKAGFKKESEKYTLKIGSIQLTAKLPYVEVQDPQIQIKSYRNLQILIMLLKNNLK